jgi:hypothetical protein
MVLHSAASTLPLSYCNCAPLYVSVWNHCNNHRWCVNECTFSTLRWREMVRAAVGQHFLLSMQTPVLLKVGLRLLVACCAASANGGSRFGTCLYYTCGNINCEHSDVRLATMCCVKLCSLA